MSDFIYACTCTRFVVETTANLFQTMLDGVNVVTLTMRIEQRMLRSDMEPIAIRSFSPSAIVVVCQERQLCQLRLRFLFGVFLVFGL